MKVAVTGIFEAPDADNITDAKWAGPVTDKSITSAVRARVDDACTATTEMLFGADLAAGGALFGADVRCAVAQRWRRVVTEAIVGRG